MGVVNMCVGQYVDHDGLSHPIDPEIKNVYWVPWCPYECAAYAWDQQAEHLFDYWPKGK